VLRLALTVAGILLATLTALAVDVVPSERTVAERIGHIQTVLRVRALTTAVVRAEDIGPRLRASIAPDPVPPSMAGPILTPLIEQDVEVLEFLKGAAPIQVGATITIRTSGGHDGIHLDDSWSERALVRGGTFVIFGSFDGRDRVCEGTTWHASVRGTRRDPAGRQDRTAGHSASRHPSPGRGEAAANRPHQR
jgi:hypothetical protein